MQFNSYHCIHADLKGLLGLLWAAICSREQIDSPEPTIPGLSSVLSAFLNQGKIYKLFPLFRLGVNEIKRIFGLTTLLAGTIVATTTA